MSKHEKTSPKKEGKKDNTNKDNTEVKEGKKSSAKVAVAVILILIAALYFGGVYAFTKVFVPRTTFYGYNFSFKQPHAVEESLREDTNTRSLTLKEIDGEEEVIQLKDSIDYEKTAVAPEKGWIDEKIPWMWPKYLFMDNELEGDINVEYSEEKLEKVIDGLSAMKPENTKPPQDAYLERDGAVYVIVPEDDGTELIRDKLIDVVKESIMDSTSSVDLDAEGCYTKSKIHKDDPELTATLEEYKQVNFQRVELDMSGITEVLETPDILNFYVDGEVSEDLVRTYVEDLADKYNTYEGQRPFVNHYGSEIIVGTYADTFGFWMDVDSTYDMLLNVLKTKKSANTPPVWNTVGKMRSENGCDIGNTYIEISIDNQALWVYQNGEEQYSTDIVTGLAGKFDTPRGVFQILNKATEIKLKGEEKGEKWESFVNFWMAINWSGIGLHNAPWRSAFGGGIYRSGGSHGCINMSYEAASYLYSNYEIGTPVVVW